MAAMLETLSKDAMVLPPDQRIALACRLLMSVEPEALPETEAAWEKEITERIRRFDLGESKPLPASEVFSNLRQ